MSSDWRVDGAVNEVRDDYERRTATSFRFESIGMQVRIIVLGILVIGGGAISCFRPAKPVPTKSLTSEPMESVPPATASELRAAQIGRFDLAQFTQLADEIVLVRVETVESREASNAWGDRLIVSTATLRAERAFKGNLQAGSEISMEVPGGTIGDVTLTVSDGLSFEVGERAVLFLARNPLGHHQLLGSSNGKHLVDEKDVMVEDRRSLAEFLGEIQKSIAGGVTR